MYNLAQNGYRHEEVLKMLKTHRKIKFEYDFLSNSEQYIRSVSSCSGTVSYNSEAEIMGTLQIQFSRNEVPELDKHVDMRVIPKMSVWSPKGWLPYQLGIYIMTTPTKNKDNSVITVDATCYDYGVVLQQDCVTDRYFVAAGTNYISAVRSLLTSAGIYKINISNVDAAIGEDIEYEIGTSKLTIINELLAAVNYTPIHFDNTGFAISERYIEPMGRSTDHSYSAGKDSIILPGGSQSNDVYDIPNVIVRYCDSPDNEETIYSQYINNNPASPLSTVSRGRNIVDVESVENIADQDTLDAYTRRVAIEKYQITDTIAISTALMPNHGYQDCVFIDNLDFGYSNKYIEYAWSMPLQVGGAMTHDLRKVVQI